MDNQKISIYRELGSTGLSRFGGCITDEFLRDLQGTKGVRAYREMSQNDPTVGAFLFAIEMIIRQVKWYIIPASEEKVDTEAAEFLEGCLDDMSMSWVDTLTEILSMLVYGWSFHEIVYKKRLGPDKKKSNLKSKFDDGRIGWRKWSIRSQETLDSWEFDDEGGIMGLNQQAPPTYEKVFIPIEKALLFRTKLSKGNPEGVSILRNAYRPHYLKKNIEDIEGIGIERDLAGLPVAWVPLDVLLKTNTDTIAAYNGFKEMITNIRRDEQEGVMMPLEYDENGNKLYDLTLLTSGGRRQFDTNQIINRYDQRILMTVLADFLILGHNKVGSFALSSDKTELFGLALAAILDSIAGVINSHAIPRLFALNDFGELSGLPELCHEDIETPELDKLGTFIEKMTKAGMITPDEELEKYLRSAASLPEKTEPEEDEIKKTVDTGTDDDAEEE